MEGALSLVGLAFAALLVVAVGVAWWEQTAAPLQPPALTTGPQAVTVDVNLDQLADGLPPHGDQAQRGAVLGQAMSRMGQSPPAAAWMDTQPIVAPGAPAEPVPSAWG